MKPVEITYVGEITNVSDMLVRKDREFRMVTLTTQDKSGAYPINEKFLKRNQNLFKEGMRVALTFQKTVAGKTTYTDADGKEQKHKTDGESIKAVRLATQMEMLETAETRFTDEMTVSKATGLGLLYGNALKR